MSTTETKKMIAAKVSAFRTELSQSGKWDAESQDRRATTFAIMLIDSEKSNLEDSIAELKDKSTSYEYIEYWNDILESISAIRSMQADLEAYKKQVMLDTDNHAM